MSDTGIPDPEGPTHLIDTEYEVGQDNINKKFGPFELDIHNPVFIISGLTIVFFVVVTLLFHGAAKEAFGDLRTWITSTFDSFFLIAGNIFVLVCLGLIISPLGKVRIGGKDATPDYSYPSWFAMLFAAGMGIGLMFYGVAEPLSHFSSAMAGGPGAPLGGAPGDPVKAQHLAMAATIFHWALHPWAIYAVVALALALFSFNKGLPLTMRSVFYPIFKERIWGWPGHVIDILAVFATLFGLATSLGYGAEQANAGLHYLFGMPKTEFSEVILIVVITSMALTSVVRGMDAGVKRLSEINMGLAVLLLLFVLLIGPTKHILGGFFTNLFEYGKYFPALANPIGRTDTGFLDGWTSFYWAWWISWSPFVGMFIARVSRGRSVREFITCVLIIPSVVSVFWMSTFGGTAIHQIVQDGYQLAANSPLELKLFAMLQHMPLQQITSVIGIILVIVFFVTSSDSGSIVIDTITAGGKVDAPLPQKVFWSSFEGLVAIALLVGGGLGSLQAMTVSTGLPFAVVLLLACYALIRGLMREPRS